MKYYREYDVKMYYWDEKADRYESGDKLRRVEPVEKLIDDRGNTHYFFNQAMFYNPKYSIPPNDYELFEKFLEGGSREYPSDGNIPIDIAAREAVLFLKEIEDIINSPDHQYNSRIITILNGREPVELIRGAIRLYLSNISTRDWRRKRSTDDIDMWIPNVLFLEHILKKLNWKYNKISSEWEKKVAWDDKWTGATKSNMLIASNDIFQKTDFGAGSFLDGSTIKDIIKKKIVRGYDVDLSDIINIALKNNIPPTDDPNEPWAAIIESANMRASRVTSNLISLCRYSYGIAYYLKRVGVVVHKYRHDLKDDELFPDDQIMKICKVSSHWLKTYQNSPEAARNRIYDNLERHEYRKLEHSRNLFDFMLRVIALLNEKYEKANVLFEIGHY